MVNCPICGNELTTVYETKCAYGTEESHFSCRSCLKYDDIFAYGGTELHVGRFTVHYDHHTNNTEMAFINRIVQMIANAYKESQTGREG